MTSKTMLANVTVLPILQQYTEWQHSVLVLELDCGDRMDLSGHPVLQLTSM
jgi:hypothetical protein